MNMRTGEFRESAKAGGWLHFAASPTFAAMAVASAITSGGPANMFCQTMGHGGWPLDGMTSMYLLMAVFHASPWWTWIVLRSRRARKRKAFASDPAAIESCRR